MPEEQIVEEVTECLLNLDEIDWGTLEKLISMYRKQSWNRRQLARAITVLIMEKKG